MNLLNPVKRARNNVLRKLIKHINAAEYPPEKALILAAMIAYIQPFATGISVRQECWGTRYLSLMTISRFRTEISLARGCANKILALVPINSGMASLGVLLRKSARVAFF